MTDTRKFEAEIDKMIREEVAPRRASRVRPERRSRRRGGKLKMAAIGAAGLAAVLTLKDVGLPIPAVPEMHEELHALPPEISDDVVVTKLGGLGAFAKSTQTYISTAHLVLVNDDGEERETLGYKGTHKVVRTQEGPATVTSDDNGNKTVKLPNTIGILARGDFEILHDDSTGRDFGQAVIGFGANSQTSRDLGQTMYTDQMEVVAANDDIATRQTLCIGVAATSQLLSDISYDGYFVPTWQAPGQEPKIQPANTYLMTVSTDFMDEVLTVGTCAQELADMGYRTELAGNMEAGAEGTKAEEKAGMLLTERRIDDQVLTMSLDQYRKESGS